MADDLYSHLAPRLRITQADVLSGTTDTLLVSARLPS
ncbi:hypothetical protein RKD23_004079 [Streptomyces sp. SAI-170]